ncbi:hypothetical protein RJ639_002190 [Escallonia herrerae]|uniref:Nucleoporin NDC1 n=1 Tax=Escallonia herrerae TaxID=1293975 RepID=A0AA89BI33_9ASTE|nr:hypothetical protein RJ639_002190 [Escallonia herrerae]
MSLLIAIDADTVLQNRFLGFLIWQSIQSAVVFALSKALLLSPFTSSPLSPSLGGAAAFLAFHLSLLLFSASLSLLASPSPDRAASPLELALAAARFAVASAAPAPDLRRRARVSLGFLVFLSATAVSAFVSVASVCWKCDSFSGTTWLRSLAVGLLYGLHHVYKRRWVLEFPIIQRPPFFSFKMGIPSAIGQALKLSGAGYFVSAMLSFFLPDVYKSQVAMQNFLAEEIVFYVGCFVVFFCWELSHHLHQVLHTKRLTFAPPKGSAAAETNPSEPLLAALEGSPPKSLLQYLAYLDLCMVCEMNVDTWRRAAFFEETGETYKRVLAVCLRPLEQFTLELAEGLESYSANNSLQLSHQLRSPVERQADSRLYEPFQDIQLYAWCARIVASLTAHSHKEDRFGVAQLSGSNAAVISTLVSCLLAVEASMGKKTNLPSSNYLMGPAGIKWASHSSGRRDAAAGITVKRKGSLLYSRTYSMADILRMSIYCVVSAFHDEMVNSSKAGLLEKDWALMSTPLYGTHELIVQKLRLFLDFQAS